MSTQVESPPRIGLSRWLGQDPANQRNQNNGTCVNLMRHTHPVSIILVGLIGTLSGGCIGPDAILGTNESGGSGATTNSGGAGGSLAVTGGTNGDTLGGTGATLSTGGSSGVVGSSSSCGGSVGAGCTLAQPDVGTVNMLLVIDESGSMTQTLPADTVSKWTTLRNALSAALSPTQVRSAINFGLELFPSSGDLNNPITVNSDPITACEVPTGAAAIEVPIIAGTDQLNPILAAINNATPAGGTPTYAALQQAYEYFTQGNGSKLNGSKWILLVTDGGPNCNSNLICTAATCTQNMDNQCGTGAGTTLNCCDGNSYICLDDTATVSMINDLAVAGINTFVVGLPGSEAYAATLNALAMAGRVPNPNGVAGQSYYGVTATNSLAELQAAFSTITLRPVVSCDIPLSASPPDVSRVKVFMNCAAVPMVQSGTPSDAGANGWMIDTTYTPAHLIFTGTPCAGIQNGTVQHIDVFEDCSGS